MSRFSNERLVEVMAKLGHQLESERFSTTQEKQTQLEVEFVLKKLGYLFEKEKRLSVKDIPDFYINTEFGGIVLEVKTKYQKRAIYRQLERYAKHDNVDAILLLSGTSMRLPIKINNKPSQLISLGVGWL